MSDIKCKMCGGTIEYEPGAAVGVCGRCGAEQALPQSDNERLAELYARAVSAKNAASTAAAYRAAAELFGAVSGFRDADELAQQCLERAEICRRGSAYGSARALMNGADAAKYAAAIKLLASIPGYRDSDALLLVCQGKLSEIEARDRARKAEEEAARLERERKAKEAAARPVKERKAKGEAAPPAQERRAKGETTPPAQERTPGQASADAEPPAKGRKKAVVLVISAVIVCAVFAIVFATVILPRQKMNKAVALYDSGNYSKAAAAFEALGSYQDAEERALSARYNWAVKLAEAGDYEAAAKLFEALGPYGDAQDRALEARYSNALAFVDAGNYEAALDVFSGLAGYKDSDKQIVKCNTALEVARREAENAAAYQAAEALLAAGDVKAAYQGFKSVKNYKDSATKAREILEGLPQRDQLELADVDDFVYFGSYEQDNDMSNGKEPIKWIVLAKEDNRLMVLSCYILDIRPFHSSYSGVNWSNSSIRSWLNKEFFSSAFPDEEQAMIPTVTVKGDETARWNDTEDKVFLLSVDEAAPIVKQGSTAVGATASAKAALENVKVFSNLSCWWLRSPGVEAGRPAYVAYDYLMLSKTGYASSVYLGIRPAMWIDLGA